MACLYLPSSCLFIKLTYGLCAWFFCSLPFWQFLFCRYILAAGGCHTVIGCRRNDIIYSPLPQYHSVAGMISLAGTMHHGISMVMTRKFSASKYWPDCVKYNVTVSYLLCECWFSNKLWNSYFWKDHLSVVNFKLLNTVYFGILFNILCSLTLLVSIFN